MLYFRLQNGLKGKGWWFFIREFQGKFAYTRQKSARWVCYPALKCIGVSVFSRWGAGQQSRICGLVRKSRLDVGQSKDLLFTANSVPRFITYDIFRKLKQGIKVFGNIHSGII